MALNEILEAFPDESFLKADGLDEAVVGLEERSMRLIYSVDAVLSEEEAFEHFTYNVAGSWVGDKTPIWMTT